MHFASKLSGTISLLVATVLSFCAPAAAAAIVEVVPVRDGEWFLSLNGPWQFRYVAGTTPPDAAPPDATTGGALSTITVPSNWELQGYAEPKYGRPDEGFGDYARDFILPQQWNGQRIILRFDGALFGLRAWLNGAVVGDWASGFNPVSFDVTDLVRPGSNRLQVRVSTRPKGWEFDTNDCWGLSGLYRDVSLFALPASHLKLFGTTTRLHVDGTAELAISAEVLGAGELTGRLLDPNGEVVSDLRFISQSPGRWLGSAMVKNPQLWTAETPTLYRLELHVSSPGQRPQTHSEKIGLREIAIRDGVLLLNNRPIKLRGVNHHDLWPDTGRATDEARLRRDLDLIRKGNCNFIRTAHYPPHHRLIELCDELGFYVMAEVPIGFGEKLLTDPEYEPILALRAQATIARDRNRPSIIVWSVGNENPNTPLTLATGRLVKELDPSRPICFPQQGTYFDANSAALPDWVDIYAPHYPTLATLARYAQTLRRPVILTEFAHGMGVQVDRIEDQTTVMRSAERLAGGALWLFQDQGLLRKSSVPAEDAREPQTSYVWPDATHYYDTHGPDGMDGMVYSDRTPQPDYWMMRKAYAPVGVTRAPSSPGGDPATIRLLVENRHDFISLADFTLRWVFLRNNAPVTGGTVKLSAVAHSSEAIPITAEAPPGDRGIVDTVTVEVVASTGESIYETSFPVGRNDTAQHVRDLARARDASPISVTANGQITSITHPRYTLRVDSSDGSVRMVSPAGRTLAHLLFAHVGRRFTEAEKLRLRRLPMWTGASLSCQKATVTVQREDSGVVLRVTGEYNDPSSAQRTLDGTYSLRVEPSGALSVQYDFHVRATDDAVLLEAGASLVLPAGFSEFRWLGAGPYAGYPGAEVLNQYGLHHISRDDIRFPGNRRRTEVALFTESTGTGLMLIPETPADISVERTAEGLNVSHNVLISGRGNKQFLNPETVERGKAGTRISGAFMIATLDGEWPSFVERIFGRPDALPPTLVRPFVRSYDQ